MMMSLPDFLTSKRTSSPTESSLIEALSATLNGMVIAGQPNDDVAPDAKIRTQRICKNERRLALRRTDRLVVNCNTVEKGELHRT